MTIGIIVYSQTGHTLSVAAELEKVLSAAGQAVKLEQVEPVGQVRPGTTDVQLKTKPEIDVYDTLVICSPVWGGTLASPLASYLGQVASLEGKRVACLITQLFPPALGGNQTLAQMKEICESKGAIVCGSGGVSWLHLRRKRKIAEVVDSLSQLFTVGCR
ncbi:MAG: flavodoxin family protein [Anaerolineae bacterium]|jgi:menaquinone-dependent protoporphyrinogen IX oxidase